MPEFNSIRHKLNLKILQDEEQLRQEWMQWGSSWNAGIMLLGKQWKLLCNTKRLVITQVFWRCSTYSSVLLSVVSFHHLLYVTFSFEGVSTHTSRPFLGRN